MIDVLVADDDETARATMVRVLSRAPGISVVGEAADGASALRQVSDMRPTVAVLDVHMPGLTGVEAATQLRLSEDMTPVVFLTADPEAAEAGLALAATSLVVKGSASVRELVEAVAAAAAAGSRRRRRPARVAPQT